MIIEPVTGVHLQAAAVRQLRRLAQALELARLLGAAVLCIGARVQFDDRRAGAPGGLDLRRLRIDEQGDADARCAQLRAVLAQARPCAHDIEAPLGRELGAPHL